MATHGPMSRRTVPRARVHTCTRLRRPCRGGRLRRRAARRAVAAQHGHRPGRRSARGRCVPCGVKEVHNQLESSVMVSTTAISSFVLRETAGC